MTIFRLYNPHINQLNFNYWILAYTDGELVPKTIAEPEWVREVHNLWCGSNRLPEEHHGQTLLTRAAPIINRWCGKRGNRAEISRLHRNAKDHLSLEFPHRCLHSSPAYSLSHLKHQRQSSASLRDIEDLHLHRIRERQAIFLSHRQACIIVHNFFFAVNRW